MKTFAAVVMFAPFVCSLAQSNLDAPAETEVVTLRSEIRRGCDEVSAAELPYVPEEKLWVAEKIIDENDRIGRKTDGFVLGVHFRIWLTLEIAWEIYPASSLAKVSADAAGGIAWLSVQGDLKRTGLTMAELIEASQLSGGEVNQRIERWTSRDANLRVQSEPTPTSPTATPVLAPSDFITLTKAMPIKVRYGIISLDPSTPPQTRRQPLARLSVLGIQTIFAFSSPP